MQATMLTKLWYGIHTSILRFDDLKKRKQQNMCTPEKRIGSSRGRFARTLRADLWAHMKKRKIPWWMRPSQSSTLHQGQMFRPLNLDQLWLMENCSQELEESRDFGLLTFFMEDPGCKGFRPVLTTLRDFNRQIGAVHQFRWTGFSNFA